MIDKASLDKWDIAEAKEAMFFYTDTADAPGRLSNPTTRNARLNCMRHFLSGLDYPESHEIASPPDLT
jgi:polyphosphate kinase 2 (PPK2 family)